MIRKLTKKDHEQVFSFLKEETALNLFIIGDIEAFGYDTDFQELWGTFEENGTLKSILLRFHDAFIPYSKEDFVVADYEALLSAYKPLKLSGKSNIVESMAYFFLGTSLHRKNQLPIATTNKATVPANHLFITISMISISFLPLQCLLYKLFSYSYLHETT